MRKLFVFLFSLMTTLYSIAQTASNAAYTNPVIAGDFADPSVIRVGNRYYAAGTSSEWAPAYPMYTSTDLVNWSYIGPAFTTPPSWTMGSFWAPELFYRNGTFYIYYTARRRSDGRSYIGVATTKDITKGFTDHGVIIEWTTEAIDAFVVEDGSKLFITWKAYGLDKGKVIELLGSELSDDGLSLKGQHFTMLQANTKDWEAGGIEGQALFKKGDWWYMTYSGNACCGSRCNYQVGLARAQKLQGPWERYSGNPVLVSDSVWKCPGHGTVVNSPDGRMFYLHHAYPANGFTQMGRQGVLSEMVWEGNWPVFKYGKATPAQAASPTPTAQKQLLDVAFEPSKKADDKMWVWDVRQPQPEFAVANGLLQIAHNSPAPAGTFLGLVIKKSTYTLMADVAPINDGQQSLCIYGDGANAMGVGVQGNTVQLWQIKDSNKTVLQSATINDNKTVRLQLQSLDGGYFTAAWQGADGKMHTLTDTPFNAGFLARWDRAPRAGVSLTGAPGVQSRIKRFSIKYQQ